MLIIDTCSGTVLAADLFSRYGDGAEITYFS